MKFSLDTKLASVVVYLSVVCRHNLAIKGYKPQALLFPAEATVSHTGAGTVPAFFTVGVAYGVVTCYFHLEEMFWNKTYFGGI